MENKTLRQRFYFIAAQLALIVAFAVAVAAQTSSFTYQGKLTVSGSAANGIFEMRFALYDAVAGGTQIGATVTNPNVSVTSGIFTVNLDFGAASFNGADRFLEFATRPAGNVGAFTTLTPRQPLAAAPYAIKSLNATAADALSAACVGCVTDAHITGVAGSKVTGQIPAQSVPTGSGNYIQNSAAGLNLGKNAPQQAAGFNIEGDGAAGGTLSASTIDAATQYNFAGSRVLSAAGTDNLFAGVGAGAANPTGIRNSFFGRNAGSSNTTGANNSLFGTSAGQANTTGGANSFFGRTTGLSNTTGSDNSFFGFNAGRNNTAGNGNSFFGDSTGISNSTGSNNSFFGITAGFFNTADNNSFFGNAAGYANLLGGFNAFFGSNAGLSNTEGDGNAFFGDKAGYNNLIGDGNAFFGAAAGYASTRNFNAFFGTTAGYATSTGNFNAFFGAAAGSNNTMGSSNTIIGNDADVGSGNLSYATAVGANAVVTTSNTVVLGRNIDTVRIPGNLVVSGTISKGGGSFRIDHPLDPANKFLFHSFVESPDMMNVYNGNITTDDNGEAVVQLPDYFAALNRDFRYQLTVIGQFAQAIVGEKIKGNSFKIRTDKPNVEVSWQVTGIRQDKFANDNRIQVEVEKTKQERRETTISPRF